MASRREVYWALDTERDYQERRWGPGGEHDHQHSVTEFLVYMRDYVEEALHHCTRNADPAASRFALNNVRKVAALGVACMEQNGAPPREGIPPFDFTTGNPVCYFGTMFPGTGACSGPKQVDVEIEMTPWLPKPAKVGDEIVTRMARSCEHHLSVAQAVRRLAREVGGLKD